jgi:hypothetical protein
VRHTPTYTPPVASRALAYIGIGAYEALASATPDQFKSLAGQLTGLAALPVRAAGQDYDSAVALNTVLDLLVHDLFANTGPTGQHAMKTLSARLAAQAATDVAQPVVVASKSYGTELATAILDWSRSDGGAVIENMGFPHTYTPNPEPGHWVPTSKVVLQQAPLLPDWGKCRPFAMQEIATCVSADPTPYSEEPDSAFFKEAMEVYETSKALSKEQTFIARFWSDDAMLSFTPPGHWVAILNQVADEKQLGIMDQVDGLARIGRGDGRRFHRLLESQVPLRHHPSDLLHQEGHRCEMGANPEYATLPGIPLWPLCSVRSRRLGSDCALWRQLQLRRPKPHARRRSATRLYRLQCRCRRGRDLASLWWHPFPSGHRKRSGTRPLHRRTRDQTPDAGMTMRAVALFLLATPTLADEATVIPQFIDENRDRWSGHQLHR